MAKEHLPLYPIPENFIEGGRVLNGLFKTRNFVEALIMSGSIGLFMWILPIYPSALVKVVIILCVASPFFLVGVLGVNGQSVFQFLQHFVKWRKGKCVKLYNYNIKSRAVRPMKVMFSQEMPKDKLIKKIDAYKEEQRKKNSQQSFVYGKDFEFKEEQFSQSYIETEKKILGIKERPKQTKKKNQKMLTDGKTPSQKAQSSVVNKTVEKTILKPIHKKKPNVKQSENNTKRGAATNIKPVEISEQANFEIIEL